MTAVCNFAVAKLIECYLHELSSVRDTQLIISTHECNLLNLDMIRSDEVWFVEKDKDGTSRLVSPLAEYKPRENVQKGYLQGRYSAIPFFAPIETLDKKNVCSIKIKSLSFATAVTVTAVTII